MSQYGGYIPFNEYRDNVTGANIDTRSTAEILAELNDLEELFNK